MERVILWILPAGAVLGGLDLLIGNRFGLGERFEEGFKLLGPTALSMAGILCLAALLVGFVSITPALAMMKEMDQRGQTMNAAFSVCAASALAAHLGFTLSAEPQMLMPLLLTKFSGGALAAILAIALTKRES